MKQDRSSKIFKSWVFSSRRNSLGRAVCAVAGIAAAATLFRLGYLSAEPTMLSGIAFAAVGAIAGVAVHGVYDVARKML